VKGRCMCRFQGWVETLECAAASQSPAPASFEQGNVKECETRSENPRALQFISTFPTTAAATHRFLSTELTTNTRSSVSVAPAAAAGDAAVSGFALAAVDARALLRSSGETEALA
jgi:hypothetical protein